MGKLHKLYLRIQKIFGFSPNIRARLLSCGGVTVGERTVIRSDCYFTGKHIKVGNNCFVNNFCEFYSYENEDSSIEIEDNVVVAMNVTFCTHTHDIGEETQRAIRKTVVAPIRIGSGTWIGANVLTLSGVTVGKGCVIAAGAVVIENCIENGLYGGVPAKLIRWLK